MSVNVVVVTYKFFAHKQFSYCIIIINTFVYLMLANASFANVLVLDMDEK